MLKGRALLLCIAAAMVLPFMPYILPFLGTILILFSSTPYILMGFSLDLRQALKAGLFCLLPVFSYAIFEGNLQILFISLQFSLMGLTLAFLLKGKVSPYRAVITTVLILGAIEGLLLLFISLEKGIGLRDMIEAYLRIQLEGARKALMETNPGPEELATFNGISNRLITVLKALYPSMVPVVTSLLCLVNLAIAHLIMAARGVHLLDGELMAGWRLRGDVIWAFILSGFGLLILEGGLYTFSLNIFIVVSCLYFFQGIAVMIYWFKRFQLPMWSRVVIFASIGLQQFLLALVAAIGIVDVWVDLRRLTKTKRGS